MVFLLYICRINLNNKKYVKFKINLNHHSNINNCLFIRWLDNGNVLFLNENNIWYYGTCLIDWWVLYW